MEAVLLLAIPGLLWFLLRVARDSLEVHIGAFASLFTGWRADGWPIGVQEEDRDRPWGRGPSAEPPQNDDQPDVLPPLTPLRPHIRAH
jgi:hypothetical protein